MLTVKQARKVLGKESDELTDEQLLVEIEAASLLKELFFRIFLQDKSTNIKSEVVS